MRESKGFLTIPGTPGGLPSATSAPSAMTTARGGDPDICAYLFRSCRTLSEQLAARRITCLFDVEPGRLPKPVCDTLGRIVEALMMDAAERALAGIGDKRIVVALRRRGAMWICSVELFGDRQARVARPHSWLAVAETLAAELKARCRRQPSDRGMMTTVAFAVGRGNIAGISYDS